MSDRTGRIARTATVAVLLASGIGLLSIPLGEYDDGIMLTGARMVAAGKMPYLDFYTHYGPFGFTLLAAVQRLVGSGAIAFRVLQLALLTLVAMTLHVLFFVFPKNSEYAVPVLVAIASAVAPAASFIGIAFSVSGLLLWILSETVPGRSTSFGLAAISGVALGAAGLTRPAFAGYAGIGLVLFTVLMAERHLTEPLRDRMARVGIAGAAAAVSVAVGLRSLYPRLSIAVLIDGSIVTPARLMGVGGARYLDPWFVPKAPLTFGGVAVCAFGGCALLWLVGSGAPLRLQGRGMLACGSIAILLGGLTPVILALVRDPTRWVVAVWVALVAGVALRVMVGRGAAHGSAERAGAAAGCAAAMWGHYFWMRADGQHALPMIAVGLVGGVCAAGERWKRIMLPGLSLCGVFLYAAGMRPGTIPMVAASRSVSKQVGKWPCEDMRRDAKAAVDYADRYSDPGSRFVAVGTSQAYSAANPAMVFAMSSRLPYTRWYQYDPGVQSTMGVQNQMTEELARSGSQTAVVWMAAKYLGVDRIRPDASARSSFDVYFDRLYPRVVARFGDYQVRVRGAEQIRDSLGRRAPPGTPLR